MQASPGTDSSKWLVGGLLVLALSGVILAWVTTPWGVRVGYDSYFYLNAAENLVKGLGLSSLSGEGEILPLTHFPPFYSVTLAAVSLVTRGDILLAAHWTAVLVYGFTLFLFGFLAYRYTSSWLAGFLSAGLFLISPIMTDIIVSAFSEGLFLVCLLLALFFLTEGVEGLKTRYLVAAGIASALACLTRYVGITIILTGVFAIFLLSQAPFKRKLFAIIGYGALSGLPLLVWYVRNWMVAGSASNRVFGIHWPKKGNFLIGIDTITGWFLPQAIPIQIRQFMLLAGLVVLVIALLLWAKRLRQESSPIATHTAWATQNDARHPSTSAKYATAQEASHLKKGENLSFKFTLISLLFCLIYSLSLMASRSFFDASTRWNSRILAPLYVAGLLAVIVIVWQAGQVERFRWRKILASGAILALYLFYAPQVYQFLLVSYREGSGFSGAAWKNSETMKVVKQFSPDGFLYSNNSTAIYFVLGRQAISIPEQYDRVIKKYRPEFEQNLNLMRNRLKERGSALVIFDPYQAVRENPPLDVLTDGLIIYQDTTDGAIFVDASQD